jgi:predicted RNA-binding Zn-ribbon protein involved in translation (DUF1610 family)
MHEVIRLGSDATKPQEAKRSTAAILQDDRIRFDCPECGNRVKAKFGQQGKPFHCPFCDKVSPIPEPHQALMEETGDSGLRRAVLWGLLLVLLGITYRQQRLWMPLFGLRPPPVVEKPMNFK